jgi:UDP-glucose 4-epimerase
VTGGAGFVGTNLIKRLLEDRHEVVSIDDYSAGSLDNHVKGALYLHMHTREIASLVFEKFDVVFHLGEYSKVTPSFLDPFKLWMSNCLGTVSVLEYCVRTSTKLVYAASSTKFSDDGENDSPYALSKAQNVKLIKNYEKWHGLQYAITYFYNVYGGSGDEGWRDWKSVINIFKDQKAAGDDLTVVSPGTQRRDFTHVEDIVDGLVRAWTKGHNDEFQLGTGNDYSIIEVAEMFEHPYVFMNPRKGDRIRGCANDIQKTKEALGWEPKHDLRSWIKQNT